MKSNRREAARRKLLNIMPRETLELLSCLERPHMATKTELVTAAAERWDEDVVRDFVERTLIRAR